MIRWSDRKVCWIRGKRLARCRRSGQKVGFVDHNELCTLKRSTGVTARHAGKRVRCYDHLVIADSKTRIVGKASTCREAVQHESTRRVTRGRHCKVTSAHRAIVGNQDYEPSIRRCIETDLRISARIGRRYVEERRQIECIGDCPAFRRNTANKIHRFEYMTRTGRDLCIRWLDAQSVDRPVVRIADTDKTRVERHRRRVLNNLEFGRGDRQT